MTSTTLTAPRPKGLSAGHFRRIAAHGFGDGRNSYAWSAVWYDDHLYVGCHRNMLVIVRKWVPIQVPIPFWPVPVPEAFQDIDLRGQIWRYSPPTDSWERAFRSPMVEGREGREVPMALGFRNMAVFKSKSDPKPAIYTIPGCGSFGLGPVLLRSIDHGPFEVTSEPGLGLGDPNVVSYRGVVPFRGRLFITPAGARGGYVSTSFNPVVYCSDDPASGRWEVSNPDLFGDPTNTGVFEMGACGDYLYAGTSNIRHGCQLWKTDAEGSPPHHWVKVCDRGFDRGPHNQLVISFAAFQGDLYLGTAIQHGGYDRFNHVGPASPEILRVHPDETWELVVGEPRMTRLGFQVPTSGHGPGFDNPLCGYIWRLRAHDGCLYAGTFDASSLVPYYDPKEWHEAVQRLIDRSTLERFMQARGGFDLWRTTAGDDWTPVTRNGFGNAYNLGVRSLISTPIGLMVGTANPFAPQVAVHGPAGWRYQENAGGGAEVWLGSLDHAGSDTGDTAAVSPTTDPWFREDGSLPYELLLEQGDRSNTSSSLPPEDVERQLLRDALEEFVCPEAHLAAHERHGIRELGEEFGQARLFDPVAQLAATPKDLVGLSEDVHDELTVYFGGSDLRNVGYWRDASVTPRQACELLIEELLALAANGPTPPPAAILTVGVGDLASQVRRLRPGSAVLQARADRSQEQVGLLESKHGQTRAADSACDILLWIEGPSALDRPAALREMARVLKPGGCLLSADLLGCSPTDPEPIHRITDRAALLSAYEQDLEEAGLNDVRLLDVTGETWDRFYRHSREFFAAKLLFQQIDRGQAAKILAALPGGNMMVAAYVLVFARKANES